MKNRIVILGGGMAALTAAFELTNDPSWQRHHSITVYQAGHRLGGKGASGRNASKHDRIEEHGLHLFYGFYDNAFHVMRRCYEELGRPAGAPLATVEEAFKPHSLVVFEEQRKGMWEHQPLLFPRNDEIPGARSPTPTPAELVPRMLRYLVELYEAQIARRASVDAYFEQGLSEDEWNARPTSRGREEPALRMIADALSKLSEEIGALLAQPGAGRREALLGRIVAWSSRARALATPILEGNPEARVAWIAAEVTLTMIRGMVADGLVDHPVVDWLSLDHEDFRAWLRRHGASDDAVDAATVRGVYAGAYSAHREIGAGTGLHWTLRMLFTYRGAMFYKMQAGMGDVVFAPLYLVLRRRGVRFRFFHRLDRLRLSADRKRVMAVDLGRQIKPKAYDYEPLVDVLGLPSWPSEPRYDDLEGGEELRASGESLEDFGTRWEDRGGPLTLRAGRDFDQVLLGIGLGAVPTVCQEILEDEGNPRFARMVRSVKTTQTASVQLWMNPDLRGTGFRMPPPVMIPYADPLDTWADMSHLLPRETFPKGTAPGSVAYLTAAMGDEEALPRTREEARGYAKRQHDRLSALAATFLRESSSHLWPNLCKGTSLDLAHLHGPEGSDGAARLAWQHVSPMHSPSDRYVLSVRGSTAHRLAADESGYDNLFLCGDWTLNPMNLGCVEGATMSGMAAARALGADVVIHDDWISARRKPQKPRAYIDRIVNDSTSPPYRASRVGMYTAILPAEPRAIRGIVDGHLNLGGDRVYLPLGPFTLFYAQNTQELEAADAPGHLPERDFGFMIPLVVCERRRGRLEPRDIAVYVPFLWVDSGAALVGGREVLGFPKGLAKLDFPEDPRGNVALRIQSTIPEAGSNRATRWREETLVEATLSPRLHAPQGRTMFEALSALSGDAWLERAGLGFGARVDVFRALSRTLASGAIRMVFLKQVRDAADPSRACHQSIVEATAQRVGPLRETSLLEGDMRVAVHRESGLAAALGLEDAMTTAIAAFYTEMNFELGKGTVVWSSGSEAPPSQRSQRVAPIHALERLRKSA